MSTSSCRTRSTLTRAPRKGKRILPIVCRCWVSDGCMMAIRRPRSGLWVLGDGRGSGGRLVEGFVAHVKSSVLQGRCYSLTGANLSSIATGIVRLSSLVWETMGRYNGQSSICRVSPYGCGKLKADTHSRIRALKA